MRVTEQRSKQVDFSFPIDYYHHGYMYNELKTNEAFDFDFLSVFPESIWLGIAISLILMTMLTALNFKTNQQSSVLNAFWEKFAMTILQNIPREVNFGRLVESLKTKVFQSCSTNHRKLFTDEVVY